jgi:hypothetical protein
MQTPITCPADGSFVSNDMMITLTSKYEYIQSTNNNNNNTVDTNTLNRKSFYESQEYENLLIWDLRLSVLYYILAIILIIILFISKNQFQLTINQRLLISLLVLIYPYIVNYIITPIIAVYRFLSSFVPKNVYNSI